MSHGTHERLARLAEEGLDAIRGGRWDTLARLLEERRALVAGIAAAASSASDADPIRRVLGADGRSLALLEAARERLGGDIAVLARSGAGLRSYRAGAGRARLLDRKG